MLCSGFYTYLVFEVGRDSILALATRFRAGRFGDRIPVVARFFAPVHICLSSTEPVVRWVLGSVLGLERPGRGVEHSPPSSAEVKERFELDFYSPARPSLRALG